MNLFCFFFCCYFVHSIISWTAALTATSYRVAISTESNQGNWTEIYSGSNTQAPIPMPLTGGIHVQVQGHNAAGYGNMYSAYTPTLSIDGYNVGG